MASPRGGGSWDKCPTSFQPRGSPAPSETAPLNFEIFYICLPAKSHGVKLPLTHKQVYLCEFYKCPTAFKIVQVQLLKQIGQKI